MKRNSKSRNKDIELYKFLDYECRFEKSEYYGIFGYDLEAPNIARGDYKKLKIDTKRFQKIFGILTPEQLAVINNRNTHYFTPKKVHREDYNCVTFQNELGGLYSEWAEIYEPLLKPKPLKKEEKHLKEVIPANDYKYQCGISSAAAAQARANFWNTYGEKIISLIENNVGMKSKQQFFGQFFHMTGAKIEAAFIKVLDKNDAIDDKFDRKILYATAVCKDKKVQDLEHFKYYDEFYCIWNFVKHNTSSTFETLLKRYPEVLLSKNYTQGELAVYWVNFSKDMLKEISDGILKFAEEYCKLIFNENADEANWNYDDYFIEPMLERFKEYDNPLGLDIFDEIDDD